MNNDIGLTRDAICQWFSLVTCENNLQIASLVTPKSLFTVTHALFFISFARKLYGVNCENFGETWLGYKGSMQP